MAEQDHWNTSDLIPLLADRGINLSRSQIYRLVSDPPERLALPVFAALCDIFDCEPGDLFQPYVAQSKRRRVATGDNVVGLHEGRPRPARIVDSDA